MKVKERLITLHDLFFVLRRYLLILLICGVAGGLFGGLYGNVGGTTTWSASGSVYVNAADASLGAGLTATDISMGRALARNCGEVLVSDTLVANVRRYFAARRDDRPDEGWEDLSAYSNAALKEMLSVEVPDNSQQVHIRANGAPTPSLACHLVNAAIGEAEVSVAPLLGALRITPVSSAASAAPSGGSGGFSIKRAVVFAVAFAALAYAVLYLAFYCSPRVQNGRELAYSFGEILPLCGVLPSDGAAEEIHAVRAELLAACGAVPCPVIGIAPVGAEGQTGAAVQALAASFAATGRRTLLMDADFRGEAMDAPAGAAGLSAALRGDAAAPLTVETAGFDLLPRGGDESVAPLLGAPAFARLTEGYRADYDVILVRLPDAARYADAGAAAAALSGVLVPVELRRTRRNALTLALTRLRAVGATLYGLLAFSPEKSGKCE